MELRLKATIIYGGSKTMVAKRREMGKAQVTLYDNESIGCTGADTYRKSELFYTDEACNTTNRSGRFLHVTYKHGYPEWTYR